MTIIKIRYIKTAVILFIVTCILVTLLSVFLLYVSKNRTEKEETPVLIPPPENIMFPPCLFKSTSDRGIRYKIDEEGNVILKNDETSSLYKITSQKEIYKADDFGDFIKVNNEEAKKIYDSLSQEKDLSTFFNISSVDKQDHIKADIQEKNETPPLYKSMKKQAESHEGDKKFTINLASLSNAPIQTEHEKETNTFLSDTSAGILKTFAESNDYTVQNNQNEKERFISGYDKSTKNKADKHTIAKGVMIPVTIITGINTDLPGLITAQVSSNIYDSYSGENIVIEKGTKIIGKYDSRISYNQNRISTLWNTLVTNTGDNLTIPSLIGVDKNGQSGWSGKVDNHRTPGIVSSLLSGLLNLASTSLNNNVNSALLTLVSGGLNGGFNSFQSSFLAKELNRQPTISIDKGEQLYLMTTSPIIINENGYNKN